MNYQMSSSRGSHIRTIAVCIDGRGIVAAISVKVERRLPSELIVCGSLRKCRWRIASVNGSSGKILQMGRQRTRGGSSGKEA